MVFRSIVPPEDDPEKVQEEEEHAGLSKEDRERQRDAAKKATKGLSIAELAEIMKSVKPQFPSSAIDIKPEVQKMIEVNRAAVIGIHKYS